MENESSKTQKAFEDKFTEIAQKCRDSGFNTLIVQVRPFCDALYKSSYFPWSHILTGTQGENPQYDALQIMCDICKENNLKIHAWINPYRVSSNETPKKLSDNNPYIKNSEIGIKTDNGIFLDPSNETAQQLISDGVKEIAEIMMLTEYSLTTISTLLRMKVLIKSSMRFILKNTVKKTV